MPWGIAAAAVVGAGASMYGADKQAGAAENAQAISQQQYNNDVAMEQPYNNMGYLANSQLGWLLGITPQQTSTSDPNAQSGTGGGYGSLLKSFNADDFKSLSPAYGFQLQQGQQGVLNADASNMGALSGAAQKDLQSYSQNFANTSFNNAFNQYQTQNQNIYNRLADVANRGQSAASLTAQQGTALAGQAAQSAQNIGTAYANGANGVANSVGNLGSLYAAYGGGGGGSNPGLNSNWGTYNTTATPDFVGS